MRTLSFDEIDLVAGGKKKDATSGDGDGNS